MTVISVRVLLAIHFFFFFNYSGLIWFSGPGSHVLHLIHFSIGSNGNLKEKITDVQLSSIGGQIVHHESLGEH